MEKASRLSFFLGICLCKKIPFSYVIARTVSEMDALITQKLMNLLLMGVTLSIFEMAFVQKLKMLPIFKKDYQVWLLNLISSFSLGIPFVMYFFGVDLEDAIWVSLFGFIGAPSIYQALKKQNLIHYKPESRKDTIEIPIQNEITR